MRKKEFLLIIFRLRFLASSLFIFLSSCGGGGSTPVPPSDPPIQNPTFSWEVVTPESQGLSAAKVTAAMNFAMEDGRFSQAAIIIKNGKIVAEQYRGIGTSEVTQMVNHEQTNWDEDTLNRIYGTRNQNALVTSWSVAKSITSIIFGIALEQGYFSGSLDTTAATYLTEWAGDSKNTITIKNLLDMRSGLVPKCYSDQGGWVECDAIGIAGGGGFVSSNDQLTECINNRSMAATEARHSWYQSGGYDFNKGDWMYQNCDTQVLGEIFFRAVGQDIKSFADTYFFSKIGITSDSAQWWRDNTTGGQANGNYLSYCCLDMIARDFARIALLLVNDGVWLGEQVIPLSYVQAIKNITTTSVVTGDFYQGTLSYGLKFWSVYGGNVCGLDGAGNFQNNGEKCVADNTIITPQGFDGQYTMMDFQNKLIMIRFSLYHHANTLEATEKKMVADSPPAPVNYILTAPRVATSPISPLNVFFPYASYWYMLNNTN
ncbi:MAG: serine hydrolase domain-containing protein [Gammaproteobacteria bacterium]